MVSAGPLRWHWRTGLSARGGASHGWLLWVAAAILAAVLIAWMVGSGWPNVV